MDVDADKLGLPGTERIDIIDVKIDDLMLRDILLQQEGFLPAYHMNKGSWMTIVFFWRHFLGISLWESITSLKTGTCISDEKKRHIQH